jgi:hypothetical protein
VLSWCVGHWSSGRIQRITQGSIMETAEVIARRGQERRTHLLRGVTSWR